MFLQGSAARVEYTLSCKRVKDGILRAMARLLELDDDGCILNQFGDKQGSTNARFNYYPACPRPDLVLGIRPHSDVCVLTLLLMDEHVAGLQVLRDGTWYGVPPPPVCGGRALLVNVGVSLEVASAQPSRCEPRRLESFLNLDRFVLVADLIDRSSMDADNVERDLQGAGAQGGDQLGEGEDVAGHVLLRGPREGDRADS